MIFHRWCHGAPSFLILLSTTLRYADDVAHPFTLSNPLREKIVLSLQRGADIVYERGFLRKGVGLCHGVAGCVYALLAVSDILDSASSSPVEETSSTSTTASATSTTTANKYLLRATHLAHLATAYKSLTGESREMRVPDHPWSLYEGVGGMCCAWGEVLNKLEGRGGEHSGRGHGMPGYADIVV